MYALIYCTMTGIRGVQTRMWGCAMEPLKPLEAGDPREVGPYRLVARLGAGGMGRVFLGRSRGGRAVAVKVVRPELAEGTEGAEFRERFAREVAAARRVNGVFTAGVVDADPDARPPWLATAYVPGVSLDTAVALSGGMAGRAADVACRRAGGGSGGDPCGRCDPP
ncbi:hypothetical protein [Streptomyces sp. NPDC127084]|uniref:hypothetical protein n=1 Tax=Streptomyces sp. NPDC127084 TaxID=3347133 RepID=UPI0036694B48